MAAAERVGWGARGGPVQDQLRHNCPQQSPWCCLARCTMAPRTPVTRGAGGVH